MKTKKITIGTANFGYVYDVSKKIVYTLIHKFNIQFLLFNSKILSINIY